MLRKKSQERIHQKDFIFDNPIGVTTTNKYGALHP